ncbi:5'-nucleotidase C-terminal domain-containing protein (plasmid) [Coraliomargarita sp. W4R53]
MAFHPQPDSTRAHRRVAAVAALSAFALGAGALVAVPAQAVEDPVEINLITVNDFHGRIEANAPAGGVAALAAAVKQFRDANANTVFAAAGDMIGASTFTSFIQNDVPTIETLNAAGLDVSAAGNHEFDKGWEDLRDRVQDLADWEYVSANVWDTETGDYALAPYWTESFEGVTIGFIGAVTEELPSLVSPAGIETLDVRPVVDSVNAVADQLSDGDASNDEADVLVLLVHEGASQPNEAAATDPNSAFGTIVNGVDDDVDAIVSGHTHLAYNLVIDGRPVISSGQYGEKFSNMVIDVDPTTKEIQSMVNTTYSMYTGSTANYPVAADDPIATMVASAVTFAAAEGAKPVGEITSDFNRGIQPELDSAGVPTGKIVESRGAESTLGNFVADVQLWAAQRRTPATQIAFMNPGGLRANLVYASSSETDPAGNVTYAEAAGVQPFANSLVTMDLSGEQIRATLEQQWQPAGSSRPFLKLGVSEGLTYTVDYAAAAGSRVRNLELDGAPLEMSSTYKVVANSFLASGGDNFGVLADGTNRADSGEIDLQGMVDWFAANGTATPDIAQRSIGVTLSPAADERGYEVGSTIDVDLSSLEFTTIEQAAETVTVAIGGKPVASAPVDRTLVSLTDEVGQATLAVTVPAGVGGTVPLTISTESGTSFDVPITVFERTKSVAIGFANKLFAKSNSAITYTVIVASAQSAKKIYPTGEVTIYDGSAVIATDTLVTKDKGIIKVKLPKLAKGVHKLWMSYAGDANLQPDDSPKIPVFVW